MPLTMSCSGYSIHNAESSPPLASRRGFELHSINMISRQDPYLSMLSVYIKGQHHGRVVVNPLRPLNQPNPSSRHVQSTHITTAVRFCGRCFPDSVRRGAQARSSRRHVRATGCRAVLSSVPIHWGKDRRSSWHPDWRRSSTGIQ
jgi:hypothetical protein